MGLSTQTTLAIIGLGYVGLPLAVEFGKYYKTLGFDINRARIAELQAGEDHTLEVEPEALRTAHYLEYTSELTALRAADIFIVTVPTPIDEYKRPDLTPLIQASEAVGKVIKPVAIVVF